MAPPAGYSTNYPNPMDTWRKSVNPPSEMDPWGNTHVADVIDPFSGTPTHTSQIESDANVARRRGNELYTLGYQGLSGALNGLGTSGSGMSGIGALTGPRAAQVNTPANVSYAGPSGQQEEASRAAIFARNKDNAANTGRAAMNGLSGELSARGMGGAGYEAGQIGRTVSNAANTLGESDRMQAQSELAHAQHVGDLSFQGDIAQRAQNIGVNTSNADRSATMANSDANRAVQERISIAGLAQQKQMALASMLSNALGGLTRMY